MSKAIIIESHGGPEVLAVQAVQVGQPGRGQLRLRQTCLGVNYHDVYVRSGQYRTLTLPGTPGIEGVGFVEEVGPGTSGFAVGDRVAYVTGAYGCYASERLLDAALAIKLPDGVDDRTAASVLLKGLTVEMLVRRVHRVKPGDTILVQAAAGAVGQLLVQWASKLGAAVIGTAGSDDKAAIARAVGCSEVILYRQQAVAEHIMALTNGRGVDVVYDGVGKDTFQGSLDSLACLGHLVNFGQASGPVRPFTVGELAGGSLSVSRPVIFHHVAQRAAYEAMCGSLFAALADGWLKPEMPTEFALENAADAHRLLESRKAAGPVILTV